MTTFMRISRLFFIKATMPVVLFAMAGSAQGQITYNWQDSKEGWVPASEQNLGCNLLAQPEAMAMRAFNATPVMRSGPVGESLNIDASDYDRVKITLKNPSSSAKSERSFVRLPSSVQFLHVPLECDCGYLND